MAEVQLLLAVVLVVVLVAFGAFVLYAGLGAVFAVGLAVFAIGLCAGGSAGFAVGGGADFFAAVGGVGLGAVGFYTGLFAVFTVGFAILAVGLGAGGSAGFAILAVGGGAGFCILAGRLGTYFLGAYFLADGFLRSLGGGADGHGGSDDGREHKGEFLHSCVSFSLSYFALL